MGLQFWLMWLALWGRVTWALLSALPFVLAWPLEMWVRLYYATPVSANFVALALESNLAEIANLLSSLGLWWVLAVAWMLLYGLALWAASIRRLCWHGRTRWVCLVTLSIATAFSSWMWSGVDEGWEGATDEQLLGATAKRGVLDHWESVFPLNQLIAIHKFQREKSALEAIHARLGAFNFGARNMDAAQAVDSVVLVIGESSTAQRWSLFGYERDTNPRLAALDVTAFTRVASVSNITRIAVPAALAHIPVLNARGIVDPMAQPSLVKAFREAGYATYWISNQAAVGLHDSSIAVYAAEAQHRVFLNPGSYSSRGSLDEILLPELERVLAVKGEKKLIVLHTLGSHFDPSLRYPSEFSKMWSSSKSKFDAKQGLSLSTRQSDAYDNSVLYTDHLLGEVIRKVSRYDSQAVVAYFSDHGVDMHRVSCDLSSPINRLTRASYHVPTIFWASEKFKQQQPQIWSALKENREEPYTTGAIFASLLEMSGIVMSALSYSELESFIRSNKGVSRDSLPLTLPSRDAFENTCQQAYGISSMRN